MGSHNRFSVSGLQLLLGIALTSIVSCDHSPTAPTKPSPALQSPAPSAQTWTISGTVSETAPTTSTPIAGAKVLVYDGPDLGRSAITDSKGAFQIAGLAPGSLALSVQAAGYVEGKQAVTLSENQAVRFELDPVFQMVTTTLNESLVGGASCPGYWDYMKVIANPLGTNQCFVDYLFNVHHDGTLTAQLTWTDRDSSPFLELYRAVGGQASGDPLPLAGEASPFRGDVYAHHQYLLRVHRFSLDGSSPVGTTSFGLTQTRPN